MPKKKKPKSKKIRKVKLKLKEIPKEESLEQEVEEQPEFTEEKFHEFLRPSTETTTPVLERIETQEPTNLEQNIISIPRQERPEESLVTNEPKYSATQNSQEEPKYETTMETPVLRSVESSRNMQRQFLTPTENLISQDNRDPELMEAESMESETRLPFERQEKKYRKAKF